MHDNVQLFKWTEQVLVHTYFNQAFVFLVYSHVFLSLYRTRLSVLAPQNYWSFSTIFICVFFQAAACKRPLWTEDHFSHCSFVCWEDSTWVGVGINNQIQGAGSRGGEGHSREVWVEYCATRAFKPRPCFRQKSFILLPCLRQETRFQDPAYLVLCMNLWLGRLCKHFLRLWH